MHKAYYIDLHLHLFMITFSSRKAWKLRNQLKSLRSVAVDDVVSTEVKT